MFWKAEHVGNLTMILAAIDLGKYHVLESRTCIGNLIFHYDLGCYLSFFLFQIKGRLVATNY